MSVLKTTFGNLRISDVTVPFGSFTRRYALPDAVDPEKVRASCRDGVLELVIGKREDAAVRRIPVRSE